MASGAPLRVIYVLERFPGPTLNFVYNEVRCLEEAGLAIEIHSLLPGSECPREAEDFLQRTRNLRPIPAGTAVRAWSYYLARKPGTLFGLVRDTVRGTGLALQGKGLRALGHLAHAVVFAWRVRNHGGHVHAHFALKAAAAGVAAARLNGQGFSFTAHGSATVHAPARFNLAMKVREADFVIAVSRYNREVLLDLCPDYGPDRIEVNRTGILLSQFPFRNRPPREEAPIRILCVATLYPVKNHAGLLRACGVLAGMGVDFRLDLVGGDPLEMEQGLRTLAREEGISDRVIFHGMVDHTRILEYYDDADIFILASRVEGIPVALMEAMARGVPVVAPRITGVPELVLDGVTGLLVDPEDQEGIAAALERLASDGELRRQLAWKARRHVEVEFDMERNANRLAHIFLDRLGGEGRSRVSS